MNSSAYSELKFNIFRWIGVKFSPYISRELVWPLKAAKAADAAKATRAAGAARATKAAKAGHSGPSGHSGHSGLSSPRGL